MKFTPGPGVGGHCIPVDPYYLSWRAREFDFADRFIEAAADINYAMPRHVIDLVAEALNDRGLALKRAKVGVLGVAFKPNVQDARNSPAKDVLAVSLLVEAMCDITIHTFPGSRIRRPGPGEHDPGRNTRVGGRNRRRDGPPSNRLGAGLPTSEPRRRYS